VGTPFDKDLKGSGLRLVLRHFAFVFMEELRKGMKIVWDFWCFGQDSNKIPLDSQFEADSLIQITVWNSDMAYHWTARL
jgi:hypothetical protein